MQPTKLTLITKQVISLKHFTAVYQSIKTFKCTIFLTILNICLGLPLLRTKQTVRFYSIAFNEPQIETFFMIYTKQTKYNNASRVVVVFTFLLYMCLWSSIFLL